jgi:hypothetical protein
VHMGRTPAPVRTRALVCPCRGPAPIAAQDLEAVRSCPRAEHGERIEGAHCGVSDDGFWTATHVRPGAHVRPVRTHFSSKIYVPDI